MKIKCIKRGDCISVKFNSLIRPAGREFDISGHNQSGNLQHGIGKGMRWGATYDKLPRPFVGCLKNVDLRPKIQDPRLKTQDLRSSPNLKNWDLKSPPVSKTEV